MIPTRFTLLAAAAFSLAFPSLSHAAGRTPETEPNDTTATANPLQFDANRLTKASGNIFTGSGGGDVDYYSFTATAGDRVYAATMTSASASGVSDTTLTLYSADGTTVIEEDLDDGSSGPQASSIAGAMIPADGTYFLRVVTPNAANTVRGYDLYVQLRNGTPAAEVEPNETPGTANANGTWVQGSVNPVGDADYHRFDLNAGDTVFLSLDLDPERDGGWDGRMGIGLFGNDQNQILVVNNAGTDAAPSEAMFMTVKESGTYYVLVDSSASASATGTYHLNIGVLPKLVENYTTYTSTDDPVTIPTGPGMASSTITIPGNPRIKKLRLKLDVTHGFMQDLDIHLRSPQGNDNGIATDIGAATVGGAQTRMDVIFDDDASTPPTYTTLHRQIVKPELQYSLGWFKGIEAGGTWTLDIRDDATGDGGTINSWSLEIIEEDPLPTEQTVYSTDFEADAGGFTASGTGDGWERGTPASAPLTTANSGSNCWKTNLDGTYPSNSNTNLISPDIDLTSYEGREVFVNWAQKYHLESANFDHAHVVIEEVGGAGMTRKVWEWTGATMNNTVGNPAVTIAESAGWANLREDISDFAGKVIRVRFHFDSDLTVQLAGWAVDDVSVTAAGVPEIAVSGNSADIANGSVTASSANGTAYGTLAVAHGSETRTYTISNTGSLPLNLGAVSLSGATADFEVLTQPATEVAAGGTTTFRIRFDPTAAGTRSALVSLVNNDADENPFQFVISGTGSAISPADVFGIMGVNGTYNRGGSVTYVAVLMNGSTFPQLDNPGNEFQLLLPSTLNLLSATATSGSAVATTGANTVTWNGVIEGSGSVTLTITATIKADATGPTISAQGNVLYDADGDGTNDAASLTDDPLASGSTNATAFALLAPDIALYNGGSTIDAPITDGQAAAINFGSTTVGLPLTRSFTIANPGSDTLNVSAIAVPSGFSLVNPFTAQSLAPSASFTFQVRYDAGVIGTASGDIVIANSDVTKAPFNFPITATRVNAIPAAGPQTLTIEEDEVKPITLAGADADGHSLTFAIVEQPQHGTLTGTAPNVTYTPNADYHGTDVFTFKVNDGIADSAPVEVNLTLTPVNDAPVVVGTGIPDQTQIRPDVARTIDLAPYFSDAETASSALTYTVNAPAAAQAVVTGSSLVINGSVSGSFDITITAADSDTLNVSATFALTVKHAPQIAGAGVPDTLLSPSIPELEIDLGNYFLDLDSDALTYSVQANAPSGIATASITGQTLTLEPVSAGETTLTLRATDSDGNFIDHTFEVTVANPVPDATPTVGAPPKFNRQTGLWEISLTATNNNLFNIPGFRFRVTSALPAGMRLHNSTAPIGSAEAYVDVLSVLPPGQSITVVLEFHSTTRNFEGFSPTIIAEPLPAGIDNAGSGEGMAVNRFLPLADGSMLIEFSSVAGRWYQIEYSSDMTTWKRSLVPVQAGANFTQWIDRGAPYTESHPSTVPSRFYRVSEIVPE